MKPKRKRKKKNTPRTKKMKKEARLESAKHWIPKYTGKNLVKGYMKRYAVDELGALLDLRKLNKNITDEQILEARNKMENKIIQRRQIKERKRLEELEDLNSDSDENFAFIAGYTSGGTPYGVTWEEFEGDTTFDEEFIY